MRTLVIDSATEACSVALFDAGTLLAADFRMLGRGHAEQLIPMIADLPGHGRAGRIAVSLGPGSFTGVRVGLAAARALAFAWDADLLGYPTLALVAAMASAARPGNEVTVAMTGGHGEWFLARYSAQGKQVDPLVSIAPEAAADASTDTIIAGSQAEAFVAQRGSGEALPIWPDARSFVMLPRHALQSDTQPLYGRAPDAKLPASAA